ncbi:hypothetical protein [Thiohalomonas denitrificans]|uniref:Uncharacterized protein n=1 Tax=Thiohalomonas denitrificans TaxID=415747 RepID=A0A1G5PYW2_9GAMM|nr:hypothetical protein [Thiohalomonas denitrificans]SCZ54582.1 hypothetical protein SAMN03097708_00994 [Thiohalomonas denitrificans]
MQWEFTPEEVAKGAVDYGLAEFRKGLEAEVKMNLGGDDEAFLQQSFDLIYDLCYWMATGREFADFAATLDDDTPLEIHVLQVIKEYMRDNITMLGAILQRLIMDGVENGMPTHEAIENAARQHAETVSGSLRP